MISRVIFRCGDAGGGGNSCGSNYADGQSANPNRQDALSRVSALQESAKSPR